MVAPANHLSTSPSPPCPPEILFKRSVFASNASGKAKDHTQGCRTPLAPLRFSSSRTGSGWLCSLAEQRQAVNGGLHPVQFASSIATGSSAENPAGPTTWQIIGPFHSPLEPIGAAFGLLLLPAMAPRMCGRGQRQGSTSGATLKDYATAVLQHA